MFTSDCAILAATSIISIPLIPQWEVVVGYGNLDICDHMSPDAVTGCLLDIDHREVSAYNLIRCWDHGVFVYGPVLPNLA